MNFPFRKQILTTFVLLGFCSILAIPAAAQNRMITGKVTDDKGQPVQDAQISIQATDQIRTVTTKTNKKGEYTYLLGVQPGIYRVVIRKAGFEPQYQQNINPQLGENTQIDFQLKPGQDYKLPFEMTDAERAQLQKAASSEKKRLPSAEVKAFFDLGVKLSAEGKYAEAAVEFNKAIEKDPKQPGILSRLAEAQSKQEKYEDALATYEKAIALSPTDPELLSNMGFVLAKLGKTTESQEAYKKAATLNPMGAAQNFYNLGVTTFNSGKAEEAVNYFKQAIAADPNLAEAYFQLGICLSAKQDTIPEALEAMKKYIEIGKKPEQVEVAKQMVSSLEKK